MKDKERGQSLTEFALSFTFIMLLIAGMVDFGRALFTYISLLDASNEGAFYASINPEDTSGITDRVQDSSSGPVDLVAATVTPSYFDENGASITAANACADTFHQVQVVVSVPFNFTMPFIGVFLSSMTTNLTASTTATILTPAC